MTWQDAGAITWTVLNSAAGVAIAGAVLTWVANRIFAWRPQWKAWEGTLISAVKWAEAAIPDTDPNRSLARLDEALRYVLRVYAQTVGGVPPAALKQDLLQGIQIVHDQLEQRGTV